MSFFHSSKIKLSLAVLVVGFVCVFSLPFHSLAQFVETPEVVQTENAPAIDNTRNLNNVFDLLILITALVFIISLFGFTIGFIKLITAGGNEVVAEESKNMMVLSSWLFGGSVLGYLLVNIVKYFIY